MDDDDSDPADAPLLATPGAFETLYVPDFVDDHDPDNPQSKKELEEGNWVTFGLELELKECLPTRVDVSLDGDNRRDSQSLQVAASRMFPVGRIFASSKQLEQVCRRFADAWAFQITHSGKKLACHFAPSIHKKSRLHEDETKRRKIPQNPKEAVACPFQILYSLLGGPKSTHKDAKISKIYYRVKITNSCFKHSCGLNTRSHREARQRAGNTLPDLNGVQDIVSMLRQRPTLSCSDLRPFLQKYIPLYQAANAQFIINFRHRALKFILESPFDAVPTAAEAAQMGSLTRVAADEISRGDNAFYAKNLAVVLQKVMQEDSSYWDAHRFLRELQVINPYVRYRVKYDERNGRPEAITWMLLEGCEDLVRYGDVLFLDAMKRDYNCPGWPHRAIHPCVKDNENMVRVTAECI
jgi:hypothetical protein